MFILDYIRLARFPPGPKLLIVALLCASRPNLLQFLAQLLMDMVGINTMENEFNPSDFLSQMRGFAASDDARQKLFTVRLPITR
jgi:hypothetical protein